MVLRLNGVIHKRFKNVVTLFLVMCIFFTSMPMIAFAEEIVDKEPLSIAINAQFSDKEFRTTYVKVQLDYTADSWSNYINAITAGIAIEADLNATQQQTDDALNEISSSAASLVLESIPIILESPTSFSATSNSYDSIKTSWNSVSGASGYEVYRSTVKTGAYSLVEVTTSTSFINTNLKTSRVYYYKIRAYKSIGETKEYSAYTGIESAKPIQESPPPSTAKPVTPTGFKANTYSDNSIITNWDTVSGASGYEIYRSTVKTGTYSLVKTTTSTNFVNINLKPNKAYYYKIRAYEAVGDTVEYSEYTGIESAIAIQEVPTPPTTFRADTYSYNSIKTTWTAASGASGYEVYRATSKTGSYKLVGSTTLTNFTNTNLITNKRYYYKVRAYKMDGQSKKYSTYTGIESSVPIPSVPTNFKAARVNSTDIKISWNKVTGASGYEVYRAISLKGTYNLIKTTTSSSYTNTKTVFGKNYYYKVRSYRIVSSKKVYGNTTSIKTVNHVGEEVYRYLTSEANRKNVHDTATSRNWGRGESNACVLFASEALRRGKVSLPTNTRSIDQLMPLLAKRGWKKDSNYTHLRKGDVCFTTDAKGNKNGRPTHTYIFMGWVTEGKYDFAYICDNQTKDFNGEILHIRNIKDKGMFNGNGKDAFSFFMYNR